MLEIRQGAGESSPFPPCTHVRDPSVALFQARAGATVGASDPRSEAGEPPQPRIFSLTSWLSPSLALGEEKQGKTRE